MAVVLAIPLRILARFMHILQEGGEATEICRATPQTIDLFTYRSFTKEKEDD